MPTSADQRPQAGSWESLFVLISALAVAGAAFGWSCWVRSWCVGSGTCSAPAGRVDMGGVSQCSFTTVVPLVADLLYHNATTSASLQALTRGVCGVGERLHLSSISGSATCMLLRPYPDALDSELMDPSASSDHQKACGAWIGASLGIEAAQSTVDYLAFADGAERAAAIRHAEAQLHNGARLATTNLGKFRAACQRTVLAGAAAVRAAGELAYEHLLEAAAVREVSNTATALASLGVLVGHYCDAPVLFGWELDTNGFVTSVRRGVSYGSYVLADALALVRESGVTQAEAEAANAWVNSNAWTSPMATSAQLMTVLRAATGRASTADADADLTQYHFTPELDGFVHLLERNQSVHTDPLPLARAYLSGIAGLCAFSLEALVDTVGYTARGDSAHARDWVGAANAQRAPAASLGALKPPAGHAPLFEVEPAAAGNASAVTLSQLVGEPAGNAASACLDFTRKMFPDEIDAIHHELVISPTLYDRMEAVVAEMRAAVAGALRHYAPVRDSLTDPDAIALDVESVRLRIPGAPRGTWAGAHRPLPQASFGSDDGVFVMAAKQARSIYLDRQGGLAYDATDACEGPAAYTPLTQNAYIYPSLRCSYYLLGMSFRPYADEAYDNVSLAARFGYIIAHELAHSSLNTPYLPYANTLLIRYPHASTKNEAFADVLAVAAVLRSGMVPDSETLCSHVSQSWCARVPPGYYGDHGQSHPQANTRGNCMCATMRDLGL